MLNNNDKEKPVKRKTELQVSAGAVLLEKAGNQYKVCLISKKKGRIWALPKGRMEVGETPEQTVLREVGEETGYKAIIIDKIDEINYHFYWRDNDTFYHKIVYFFLLQLDPTQTELLPTDNEADEVRWFRIGDAYKKLTYLNEKEVMRKAKSALNILKF